MIVELNLYKFKENVELNLKKNYYLMGPVILIAHSESNLMKTKKPRNYERVITWMLLWQLFFAFQIL